MTTTTAIFFYICITCFVVFVGVSSWSCDGHVTMRFFTAPQTGMSDGDYITAFQRLLLPVAHEVEHARTRTHTQRQTQSHVTALLCFSSSLSWFWCAPGLMPPSET